MHSLLNRAEISLEAIREFNRQVPFTPLLRCVSRDLGLAPRNIGGGEDWFSIYKEQWKLVIDEKVFAFIKIRRQHEMQSSFKSFLKGKEIRMLEHMESGDNPQGMPLKGAFALSFLQTFCAVVFAADLNETLRPIMLNGEFIRKENRAEYTECYNYLMKLSETVKRLDHDISPEGTYGKRYQQAKNEMTALPVKRRKIQIILNEATAMVERILEQTRNSLSGLVKSLNGIITKNDKYDSLSNLADMLKNPAFFDRIAACIDQLTTALKLMDDIDALEGG
jgi:hypothetical protein